MNTDKACTLKGRRTTYGGLVRDHTGAWIRGFSMFEGFKSALSTRLKGIYHGLKMVSNLGFKKVWLEFNNVNALALMENGCSFHHDQYLLVMDITKLLAEDWEIKFSHTYRKQNLVTN